MKQLGEEDDIDSLSLEAMCLSLANLKEVGASWLVEAADYVSEKPLFTINGFCCSRVTAAIDKDFGHRFDNSEEIEEMGDRDYYEDGKKNEEDSAENEEYSCSNDEDDELEMNVFESLLWHLNSSKL